MNGGEGGGEVVDGGVADFEVGVEGRRRGGGWRGGGEVVDGG